MYVDYLPNPKTRMYKPKTTRFSSVNMSEARITGWSIAYQKKDWNREPGHGVPTGHGSVANRDEPDQQTKRDGTRKSHLHRRGVVLFWVEE